MDKFYYDTICRLEKAGAEYDYINGWACGYLNNQLREEQRITETYSHGYKDGQEKLVEPSRFSSD